LLKNWGILFPKSDKWLVVSGFQPQPYNHKIKEKSFKNETFSLLFLHFSTEPKSTYHLPLTTFRNRRRAI